MREREAERERERDREEEERGQRYCFINHIEMCTHTWPSLHSCTRFSTIVLWSEPMSTDASSLRASTRLASDALAANTRAICKHTPNNMKTNSSQNSAACTDNNRIANIKGRTKEQDFQRHIRIKSLHANTTIDRVGHFLRMPQSFEFFDVCPYLSLVLGRALSNKRGMVEQTILGRVVLLLQCSTTHTHTHTHTHNTHVRNKLKRIKKTCSGACLERYADHLP